MKDKVLVCASIAYDYLMSFSGTFKETINEKTIDALSVSFLADTREKFFGGCGANISYNLALLGQKPILFSAVGSDFTEYDDWLSKNHVDTSYVPRLEGELTASAYILSDKSENQIAVFSPGASGNANFAMNFDNLPIEEIAYAIIGPDNPMRVMSLVQECIRLDIPYIFDPGQITHVLSKDQLLHAISNAKGLIANEFETKILEEKTGLKSTDFSKDVEFFISTLGEKGCDLMTRVERKSISAVKAEKPLDPTGCGDAFRAGLLAGLVQDKDLSEAVQMGILMGTLTVAEKGTQNHSFSPEDFERYYEHAFN